MRSFARSLRSGLVAIALAATVAACGTSGVPALPGAPVGIRTAPQIAQACMDALLAGVLARNPVSGLGVAGSDGSLTPVEWPFGYAARADGVRLALLDETGAVVAREGDEIAVGGGFGNELWHACGSVTVTRAAT